MCQRISGATITNNEAGNILKLMGKEISGTSALPRVVSFDQNLQRLSALDLSSSKFKKVTANLRPSCEIGSNISAKTYLDNFVANVNKFFMQQIVERNQDQAALLIHLGADVNGKSGNRTCLELAHGDKLMMNFLLRNGAKVDDVMSNGSTALEEAVRKSNYEICALLFLHGAKIPDRKQISIKPLLHEAVELGNLDMVRLLVANGANLNQLHRQKFGVLDYLYEVLVVPVLWLLGMDIPEIQGVTALHVAAKRQDLEMVTLLEQRGAKRKISDCDGETYRSYLPDDACGLTALSPQWGKYSGNPARTL